MVRRGTGEIKKKKGGLERVERKREISLRRGGFFFFFLHGEVGIIIKLYLGLLRY